MSTIEKIAVYDARIIQESPKYAVQKGALSISVSPFNAISASASQHTYQILVPSLNVFVDRKIDLKTGAYVSMEAVPSQYTSVSYASSALANTCIKNATALSVPEPFSPTSTAVYSVQQSVLDNGFKPELLGANSTITFSAGLHLTVGARTAGGTTTDSTVTISYTSGLPFTSAAARTLFKGCNVTFGTGAPSPNVITDAVLSGSSLVLTLQNAITTNCSGTVTIISTVPITQVVDRVLYQTNYSQLADGTAPVTIQLARLFVTPSISLFSGFGTATVRFSSSANQIATPQFVSTSENVVLPQEVILADGTRGYGINSGFLLPRGSFPGCTGPTDNNWYQPVGGPSDLSLCMFPIQSLCTNMTASINDCSVTTNGDTLKEQILLSQTRASLQQRTCTSKFDTYAYAIDDVRSANGSTRTYGSAKDSDIGNGSWQVEFVHPASGDSLPQYGSYTYNGVTVPVINYRPAFIPQGSSLVGKTISDPNVANSPTSVLAATNVEVPLPVMIRFYCSEPLVMSPFLWQDAKEMTEVGLYGCTNIALTLNLQGAGPQQGYETLSAPAGLSLEGRRRYCDKLNTLYPTNASIIRSTGLHALYSKINLQNPTTNATSNTGPFISPRLMVTFLTPPPDVTLPMVSTVPYMEFPRYFSPCTIPTAAGSVNVQSNTITLSSIPDLLAIYVKANVRGQTQQENYIPIERIGVTFDNYSNLCSNFQQEDLYACTVAGGLDMDWQQWRGWTNSTFTTDIPFGSESSGSMSSMMDLRKSGKVVQMSGGPLLLRMGQDIPLSPGLAPGTLGNFSVQLNITLDNTNGFYSYLTKMSANNNATIIIMAINSGFFETVRGQSAVRKTILNSVDVEAASVQSGVTSSHLRRMVGGNLDGVTGNSDLNSQMGAAMAVSGNSGSQTSAGMI